MIFPNFTEANLRSLLEAIQLRARRLDTIIDDPDGERPIYLRFDIDDNFRRAYQMSCICNEYGIRATFFILNTAKYWQDENLFDLLQQMQRKGHEIAWHNNSLTEWSQWAYKHVSDVLKGRNTEHIIQDESFLTSSINATLDRLRSNGIAIRGSASHGDPLCRKLGFINYEVFTECPRTEEAVGFPEPKFTIPKVSMHSFGLEYEAYHVPYDLYLSESGGQGWTARHSEGNHVISINGIIHSLNAHDRIQILIHPQHWKI